MLRFQCGCSEEFKCICYIELGEMNNEKMLFHWIKIDPEFKKNIEKFSENSFEILGEFDDIIKEPIGYDIPKPLYTLMFNEDTAHSVYMHLQELFQAMSEKKIQFLPLVNVKDSKDGMYKTEKFIIHYSLASEKLVIFNKFLLVKKPPMKNCAQKLMIDLLMTKKKTKRQSLCPFRKCKIKNFEKRSQHTLSENFLHSLFCAG